MLDQLLADLRDPFEVWRRLYSLPVTDPRYLEVTEEDVLRDLVADRIASEQAREAVSPGEVMAERLAADKDEQTAIVERADQFIEDNQAAFDKLRGIGGDDVQVTSIAFGPLSITLGKKQP